MWSRILECNLGSYNLGSYYFGTIKPYIGIDICQKLYLV